MRSISVYSPAKLNLHLSVLGRRPDGYHELFTLFHRISLKDRITVKKITKPVFSLKTNHPELGRQNENLIYKAYQVLKRASRWKGGIEVKLDKKVPLVAGLGGGSSNAASFLLAMNHLFRLKLSRKTLVKLGLKLGADVPFFLYEVNQAFGSGIGEKIKPSAYHGKLWFVVVVPPFKLSTALVYRRLKAPRLTRISRDATITSAFSGCIKKGLWQILLGNDLFEASCALRPELRKVETLFDRAGASEHLMSGSGSAMFSLHRSKAEARRVAHFMKRSVPRAQVFVCHTY